MKAYTISDDEARDVVVNTLNKLGFEDAEDQSTMVCKSFKQKRICEKINNFCTRYNHTFEDGDTITIFNPKIIADTACICQLIIKYNSDKNQFC